MVQTLSQLLSKNTDVYFSHGELLNLSIWFNEQRALPVPQIKRDWSDLSKTLNGHNRDDILE